MAQNDFRMPPPDYPVTREFPPAEKARGFLLWKSSLDASENQEASGPASGPAPEDQPLPPEETAPGSYIYTPVQKRSFKSIRKKLQSMYAAAAVAVLLLTNIIPLYHSQNQVLPSGNLRILSVLTSFAGWEDENGHTVVFKDNGTGFTYNGHYFGPLSYTGGEEGVDVEMGWMSLDGGQGHLDHSGTRTINNDNLKADGANYTLTLQAETGQLVDFRPVNFLSLNTKNIDNFLRYGIRGLFPDTEWIATTEGVEEIPPSQLYTRVLRLGAFDQNAGGLASEGVFDVSPDMQGNLFTVEPDTYKFLFHEDTTREPASPFFFLIDPDDVLIRTTVRDSQGDGVVYENAAEHFYGVVLVSEEEFRLSWFGPYDDWRTYRADTKILPPDERSDVPVGPTEPDETEEPTEEPVDVWETLTGVPGWVSDDGAYYVFNDDGTGWVCSDGYFGLMSFEGDEASLDLSSILVSEDFSYSDEKEQMISSVTKQENHVTLTSDAFSEEDGVMTVMLRKPSSMEDVLFKATTALPDTTWLELSQEKGFTELNRLGYWFIEEEYIPEASYPTPYVEFISFSSEDSLIFVFNTTEPVEFTSDYAFETGCGLVDPMTYEYAFTEKISLEYKPLGSSGGYSSYTHTQDPKEGYIRLIIREDGLYVYADVPMGRPNLYKYREN